MINITKKGKVWRMDITEVWEFPNYEEFKKANDNLMAGKNEFGVRE